MLTPGQQLREAAALLWVLTQVAPLHPEGAEQQVGGELAREAGQVAADEVEQALASHSVSLACISAAHREKGHLHKLVVN